MENVTISYTIFLYIHFEFHLIHIDIIQSIVIIYFRVFPPLIVDDMTFQLQMPPQLPDNGLSLGLTSSICCRRRHHRPSCRLLTIWYDCNSIVECNKFYVVEFQAIVLLIYAFQLMILLQLSEIWGCWLVGWSGWLFIH